MMEQMEMDRKALKQQASKPNGSQFSYIPYLVPKKEKKKRNALRITALSTLNILCYVDESFRLSDKYVISRLPIIKEEILKRKELFSTAMQFISQHSVKSNLYYWNPGLQPDNIFKFITDLLPNFVILYKKYLIKSLVTKSSYYDCLPFIKEHFRPEYPQFEIIRLDNEFFTSAVTSIYWSDEEHPYCGVFPEIPAMIDISSDVEGRILPDVSFVECFIAGRTFIVELFRLEGLILKRKADLAYWLDLEIVDEDWNILEEQHV